MVLRIEKLPKFSRPKKQAHPTIIAQDHQSTLAELGGYLRQTRLQQSKSLEEIGQTTLIPLRILTALEEGSLERLPEPVYIQAFLRRYADALGLNGAEFSSSFPITINSSKPPSSSIWSELSINSLRPIHLYFLYIVLIFLAVSGLSAHLNSSAPVKPSSEPKPSVTPLKQDKANSTSAVHSATAAQSVATPATMGTEVGIKVTLKSESWVQVEGDGATLYEGVLPAGADKHWQAKKTLEVTAGNAGGVWVGVNGASPQAIGSEGEVKSAIFHAPDPQLKSDLH